MSHIVEPVGNPVFHFTSLQLMTVEFKRKKERKKQCSRNVTQHCGGAGRSRYIPCEILRNEKSARGPSLRLAASVGVGPPHKKYDYRTEHYCFRQSLLRLRPNRSSKEKERASLAFTWVFSSSSRKKKKEFPNTSDHQSVSLSPTVINSF
jgi:hypothetical protein